MVNVGVIGMGMMGSTHLDAYSKHKSATIVAVSDRDEDLLHGRRSASGNIEGQAQGGVDLSAAKKYAEGMDLIRDPNVELVDICLWTPLHLEYALAALKAGKHLLIEKPLARTHAEAVKLAAAAEKAPGLSMCAMCMRFWPGWDWLKAAVDSGRYGPVRCAQFRRVADHPGGPFYSDGDQCGGAILDLHVHDTDFVQYLFGTPKAVYSRGYSRITSATDHVVTQYEYDDVPIVVAEGGWDMAKGFGFTMRYAVNFDKATAVFDLAAPHPLTLIEPDKGAMPVALDEGMGYGREIDYFLNCIATGTRPSTVTLTSAAESVRIVEAELESVRTGRRVTL